MAPAAGLPFDTYNPNMPAAPTPKGFDPSFLRSIQIQLPKLTAAQTSDAARMIGTRETVIPYTNFSVVQSKSRRMAVFTAVNIDGATLKSITRKNDNWRYESRIERAYQLGGRYYSAADFDRGHLVRRIDPAWGANAKRAESETFRYTNAAPQIGKFNRDTWNELEDYVLKNADVHDLRINVFTGPVFRKEDPLILEVRVPQEFWKIVVMVKSSGAPSATAYLLTQRNLLGERDFAFGEFKTYQVKIRAIETLSNLTFDGLDQHDPMSRSRELVVARRVNQLTDILT
jgi:endonuclease G, mitochondrial